MELDNEILEVYLTFTLDDMIMLYVTHLAELKKSQ